MSQKLSLIAIFVITLLFQLFFYDRSLFGLGWLVLFAIFHLFFLFSNFRSTTGDKKLAYISSILTLCIASIPFWRSNQSIALISQLATLYGSCLTLFFYRKPALELRSLSFFQLIVAPLEVFFAALSGSPSPAPSTSKSNPTLRRSLYTAILKGLLLALPLIFILFAILRSADPIFAQLLSFNLNFDHFSGRLLSSAVVFLALFLSIRIFFVAKNNKDVSALKPATFAGVEDLIVVGSIVLLFAVFLLVQLRYLFFQIDERSLLSLGLEFQTFAEYTRQGFEQLLFAAVIVVGVLIAVLSRVQNQRFARFVKLLNITLIAETTILLLSALRRWLLYFSAHGLTIIRYMGLAFLIWLIGWLAALALQNYFATRQGSWTRGLLAFSFLVMFSAAVLNPDKLIVRYFPPTVNDQIDYVHLSYQVGHDADEFLFPLLSAELERKWQEVSAQLNSPDMSAEDKWQILQKEIYAYSSDNSTGFSLPAFFHLSEEIDNYRTNHTWTNFNLSLAKSSAQYFTAEYNVYLHQLEHLITTTRSQYYNQMTADKSEVAATKELQRQAEEATATGDVEEVNVFE